MTEGIREHYINLSNKKLAINIVRNGYDFEKFKECNYNNNFRHKKELVFSHIGSIYKGRNIADFLKALDIFSSKTKIKITFNIVGVLDKDAYDELKFASHSNIKINILGTLPHLEAIEYLKKSDIAVILTHKKGSEYAIPGKTFEYIGACKPIIAVTEDKELVNLIEPLYGECAKHNPNAIAEKLIKLINSEYDFSNRKIYSREQQAIEIINMINKLIDDHKGEYGK